MDIHSEPIGFKLCSDYSSFLTAASAPNVILDLADFGGSGIYTFCASGEIYKDSSGTAIYTDVTGSAIVQATAMWVSTTLYIYYFTAIGVIHRIGVDGTGHAANAATLVGGTSYPVVKHGGDIYFGDRYTFKKLPASTETVSTILTLPTEVTLTGITFFQDSFKLYGKVGKDSTGDYRDGVQYIIRAGETDFDYQTDWNRLPILGVCNQGANDYVVTGAGPNYTDLYITSGTQRTPVKTNFEGMTYGRKFSAKIVSWKDEVFLIGTNLVAGLAFPAQGNSVFRLGKYFPGLPLALTEIYRGSSGWALYSIIAGYNNLYIGRKGLSGVFTCATINLDTPITSTYQGSGYIISQVFDGGDKISKKTLDQIEISYMCDASNPYFPHGGTITLYGRMNPADSWTQIGSAYAKTDNGTIRIGAPEINTAALSYFYQLELKCSITQ